MNKFCHIALLFVLVSAANAQRLPFKNYTTADGLPGPVIRDIVQDKYGYVWINTDGGVAQFDGVTFKNYTVEDSLAYIFCDSAGYVYLAGRSGLWRLTGEERVFYPFTRELGPVEKLLYIKDGSLWFWHQRNRQDTTKYAGLSKLANDRLEEYPDTLLASPTESNIAEFVDDQQGGFWVQFRSIKSKKITWHRFANGKFAKGMNAYGISEDWDIWDFKVDRYGSLWFFRNKGSGEKRLDAAYKFTKGRLVEYSDSTRGFHFLRGFLDGERNLWLIVHGPHQADNSYRGLGVAKATEDTLEWFNSKDGLPDDKIRDIAPGKHGRVWFIAWEGVSQYEAGKMENITRGFDRPEALAVWGAFEDSKDNVWFAWRRNVTKPEIGVTMYAKGKMKNYTAEHGGAGDFWVTQRRPGADMETVFREDKDGDIWLQSNKALHRISNEKLQKYDQETGLAGPLSSERTTFLQDREGNFWIGTQNGLSKLTAQRYELYTKNDGLIDGVVRPLHQDRQGRLWVRGEKQLQYISGNRIEKFTFAHRLLYHFYEDKSGNIWMSTLDSLKKFDGAALQDFNVPQSERVYFIFQDDRGHFWFGDDKGVNKFDGKGFQFYAMNHELLQAPINLIVQDWRGHLWFVSSTILPTMGGISEFDGTTFRNYTTSNGELSADGWSFSIDQRKHVWLRQRGGLRDLTDPGVPGRKVPDLGPDFTLNLSERRINLNVKASFWDREGNYWLGMSNGLLKVGPHDTQTFTAKNGLPGNNISGIAQDSLGYLWIGTHKGIGVFDGTRFHDYNREHGLEPIAIEGKPIVDRSGNVWFGSVAGLIKVNAANAFEKTAPPLLYFKSIQIDTLQIPSRENLKLEYSQNNLVFSYIGLCFKNEKALRYQYWLEGYDEKWSPITDKREVRYTNLDPGGYVFKVKAFSGAGVESEIASAAFRILPPFWKTWWFITISSVSTFLLGYVVYRRRVNAKLEKARIMNELKTAHDMQMGLMPTSDPIIPGFDISGICKPAEEVGGDYFDYVWLDTEKTKLGIAIVDVSGKAMKGAMTAVMTSGMIYSEIGNNQSPRAILQKINRPMYLKTDRQVFTAMSFAVIDTQDRTMALSNAGQAYPVLKRDGEIQYLKVEGMHFPLGIQEEVKYGEITMQLQSGDLVIFYTDGIPEAMNEKNELFDFERLEAVIRNLPASIRAAEVIATLLQAVSRFSGAAEQHDDMTVVALRVV